MADIDTEWEPVIPMLLGNEAIEEVYQWNDNDDAATQVRGMVHNLLMDEQDPEIKLMAADYTIVITGIRQPLYVSEDGIALIGVYYGQFDEDTGDKISVIKEYTAQTRYLGDDKTAVFTDRYESLDETAFQGNLDELKRLCDFY